MDDKTSEPAVIVLEQNEGEELFGQGPMSSESVKHIDVTEDLFDPPLLEEDAKQFDNWVQQDANGKSTSGFKMPSFKLNCFKGLFNEGTKKFLIIISLCTLVILSAIMSGIIFGFTTTQFSNVIETNLKHKILATSAKTKPCDAMYQPLQFKFNDDPTYLQCSWPTNNQMLRLFLGFLSIFWGGVGIYAVKKSKRIFYFIYFLGNIAVAFFFFWAMCIDSNDVRSSRSWCEEGMEGASFSSAKGKMNLTPEEIAEMIDCNFTKYIIVCLLDAGAFVLWAAVAALSFQYYRLFWNKGIIALSQTAI